jgi:hypothetical protein
LGEWRTASKGVNYHNQPWGPLFDSTSRRKYTADHAEEDAIASDRLGAGLPWKAGTEYGMTADTDTILPGRPAARRSWLQRLGRSNASTITLSVLLHGSVFLAFYHVAFREARPRPTLIIPEARLAPAGGPAPSRSGEMPKLTLQPTPPPPDNAGKITGTVGPAGGSPLVLSELPVVAVNLTNGAGWVVGDADGSSHGSASLAGAGSSGGSLLGTGYAGTSRGGASVGPMASFFGAVGNAYKVVYVVDISVSVSLYLPDIVKEMSNSIRGLTPAQQFHILTSISSLHGELEMAEFGPHRLVYATERYKQDAFQFMKNFQSKTGAFDPIKTMTRAYELKPELIYFLSDGDYDDVTNDLPRKVRELYARHPAKITIITFNPHPRHVQLLETIARDTGGHFRLVEDSKLGK